MKIKLVFDAQFVGRVEYIIKTTNKLTDKQIKGLSFKEFGIQYDDNCYYEILE
jgi:hypothetical protein